MLHPPTAQVFVLFNVYFPSHGGDTEGRHVFKLQFHVAFGERCRCLLSAGRDVVVVGDVNISRAAIDHCDPAEYVKMSGHSFESSVFRQWLSSFLSGSTVTMLRRGRGGEILITQGVGVWVQ